MNISNLVRNALDLRGIPRITIVYATLVLALLAVLLAQNTGRPASNTITMPALPDEVVRIEIKEARGELTLLRREDQWFVGADDEQLFPAREEAVARLLDRLRELTRLEVVSERGSDQEYGFVEAARRRVRIEGSSGDSLLLELGFTAASGEAIYARLQGDRTVVRLPRALHNAVGSDPEDYREMVVARIPEDTIRRVEIVGGIPGTLQVERVGAADRRDAELHDRDRRDGDSGDGDLRDADRRESDSDDDGWRVTGDALDQLGAQVRPERIQDLLRELASLAAMGFPDEGRLPLPEPFVTIRVETIRGPTHTIEIAPPDEDWRLPAVSTTSPYPFYLPEWRVRRLLLGIEAYLEPYMETPPQF